LGSTFIFSERLAPIYHLMRLMTPATTSTTRSTI
jgi:hypothetical protein